MQAIESIGNAALELPRRSSPFRALVWKEWRQQRWIFLSFAGLTYAMLGLALLAVRFGRFFRDFNESGASIFAGCAMLAGFGGIAVLSANAFSGEHEDNSDLFLATIPCSRSKLFWLKLGFVMFLVLAELMPLAALMAFGNGRKDLCTIAPFVPLLAIVPALIASFGGSVIATILASAPVVAACAGYMSVSSEVLGGILSVKSEATLHELSVGFSLLMLATILMAAWRMWIRIERTWRRSLRTAAATAGLLIACVVGPAAPVYIYVTFFAPLSYFMSNAGGGVSTDFPLTEQNGRYVTFSARFRGWGRFGQRVALVDVDSGRARWLTRFEQSRVWPRPQMWSPSGNQFVLDEAGRWLWPLACEEAHTYFVVDARSGEKRSFDELCPGLPQMPSDVMSLVGWYSENVFAFTDGWAIIFADIEHHTFHECKRPATSGPLRNLEYFPITQRGVFGLCGSAAPLGETHLIRYAPDLYEAESLPLRGMRAYPDLISTVQASNDGRYLLLSESQPRGSRVCYVIQVADEAACTLLLSGKPGENGLISAFWQVDRFIPNTHQILLHHAAPQGFHAADSEEQMGFDAEIGLFDADSHVLRRIPLTQPAGIPVRSVELSPGGGFALVWRQYAESDRNALVGTTFTKYSIVDLHTSASQDVQLTIGIPPQVPYYSSHEDQQMWWPGEGLKMTWLGEEHLLCDHYGRMPWVVNRDGNGARPMLAQ